MERVTVGELVYLNSTPLEMTVGGKLKRKGKGKRVMSGILIGVAPIGS